MPVTVTLQMVRGVYKACIDAFLFVSHPLYGGFGIFAGSMHMDVRSNQAVQCKFILDFIYFPTYNAAWLKGMSHIAISS